MLAEHLGRSRKLVQQMTLAEKMSQMVHNAPAIERLGISAYNWWNEGLHGVVRSGVATVFPQAIGLSASFNMPLMQRTATRFYLRQPDCPFDIPQMRLAAFSLPVEHSRALGAAEPASLFAELVLLDQAQ